MTLKEAVARRDELMAFVIKADKLKAELNREKKEFEREKDTENETIVRQWADLAREKEDFAREVDAWDELQKEARMPHEELERITKECDALRQEKEHSRKQQASEAAKAQAEIMLLQKQLAEEKKQYLSAKEIADVARNKISGLTEANKSLSKELDSLKTIHARDTGLLESATTEIASLKKERKSLRKEKQDLLQEKQDLLAVQSSHEKTITTLKKSILNQKVKMSGLRAQVSSIQASLFCLSDLELLDALSREAVEFFHPPRKIVTLGSGPIAANDFKNYLIDQGKQPMTKGSWIVVGRDGWTEKELDDLLDQEEFEEIRVFSQELFMVGMLTTHDPFSLPIEILMKFAEDHPALKYIRSLGFAWPEIFLDQEYGESQTFVSTSSYFGESPLTHMGYRVGYTRGLHENDRREILKAAFKEDIPDVGDDDYMAEWGFPKQPRRLWKIADHLKREVEKRKNLWNMQEAVNEWIADSEWLKAQFYTRRMRFPWPYC